ncbi:GXWXG domain-containing protein [Streptomyces sp. N35]|uniref:GXWXG domain-containing protein n=1 Tax=Streptomyces sp. N35 TaxID=2795730 RepID=UPI0018F591B4|nr:GXWXG domain-containing protein [Streptomyces sp. N35]
MNISKACARFGRLRAAGALVDPDELDEIWQAFECLRPEEVTGDWRGIEFDTGHLRNGQSDSVAWYRKTFESLLDARPLMCRDDDSALYSSVEPGQSEVTLWSVEFRGETATTMVRDGRPLFDQAKKVDDGTLTWIMNGEGRLHQERHLSFSLDRD